MSEQSRQHDLDDEGPRVHMTLDVQADGSPGIQEIPAVVAVTDDLMGQPSTRPPVLQDRAFTEIDSMNFDNVLESMQPRFVANVKNRLQPGSTDLIPVEIKPRSLEEFSPAAVARQVPILNDLMQLRTYLQELLEQLPKRPNLASDLTDLATRLRDATARTQKQLSDQSSSEEVKS